MAEGENREEAIDQEGAGEAEGNAPSRHHEALPHDQCDQACSAGPKRCADSDLPRPLRHEIREDAVEHKRRERNGTAAKLVSSIDRNRSEAMKLPFKSSRDCTSVSA